MPRWPVSNRLAHLFFSWSLLADFIITQSRLLVHRCYLLVHSIVSSSSQLPSVLQRQFHFVHQIRKASSTSLSFAIMFHRTSANQTNAQGTRRTRGALRDVSNQRNDDNGVKNGKPNPYKRGNTNNNNSSSVPPSRSGDNVGSVQRDDVSTTSNNNTSSIPLVSQGSIPSSGSFMPADNSALSGYQYSGPADDIDERDTDDPLCVTSYVQDMYEHFRTKEGSTSVRPVYMEDQQYINERMPRSGNALPDSQYHRSVFGQDGSDKA
eukprot:scaffold965_cov118-Skeletonema_marinoi.AAC.3